MKNAADFNPSSMATSRADVSVGITRRTRSWSDGTTVDLLEFVNVLSKRGEDTTAAMSTARNDIPRASTSPETQDLDNPPDDLSRRKADESEGLTEPVTHTGHSSATYPPVSNSGPSDEQPDTPAPESVPTHSQSDDELPEGVAAREHVRRLLQAKQPKPDGSAVDQPAQPVLTESSDATAAQEGQHPDLDAADHTVTSHDLPTLQAPASHDHRESLPTSAHVDGSLETPSVRRHGRSRSVRLSGDEHLMEAGSSTVGLNTEKAPRDTAKQGVAEVVLPAQAMASGRRNDTANDLPHPALASDPTSHGLGESLGEPPLAGRHQSDGLEQEAVRQSPPTASIPARDTPPVAATPSAETQVAASGAMSPASVAAVVADSPLVRIPDHLLMQIPVTKDHPTTGTPVDHARLVQRVSKALEVARQRDGEVRLRLSPPELGALRLEVRVRDGVLVARMEAETQEARQLLLESLPTLRDRLQEHGIRIERFDVDLLDRRGFSQDAPHREPFRPPPESTTEHTSVRQNVPQGESKRPEYAWVIKSSSQSINVVV